MMHGTHSKKRKAQESEPWKRERKSQDIQEIDLLISI